MATKDKKDFGKEVIKLRALFRERRLESEAEAGGGPKSKIWEDRPSHRQKRRNAKNQLNDIIVTNDFDREIE